MTNTLNPAIVERAAEAMYVDEFSQVRESIPMPWGDAPDFRRNRYRSLARAALQSAIPEAVEGCPICDEIVEINDERIQQEQKGFIDTPGGFEHMGDVWNQISKWADLIRARCAIPEAAESEKASVAAWMLEHSYPTGHGDTVADLLIELIGHEREALEESVKLQSHYAALLNQYDGGNRRGFASSQAWIDRIAGLRARGAEQKGG
jgi:hypothetical protein